MRLDDDETVIVAGLVSTSESLMSSDKGPLSRLVALMGFLAPWVQVEPPDMQALMI